MMETTQKQKLKILYLLQFLLTETDKDHAMTMQTIIEKLAAQGIAAERKSIYADFKLLSEFGYAVERVKTRTVGYFIEDRDFELAELKLLVDAVQSSRFITERRSAELIRKLSGLTSQHRSDALKRYIVLAESPKSLNKETYYNIDAIHEAINNTKKITFQYFDYDVGKKLVMRKDSKPYCLTPVALTWNDDKYYLICYHPKYEGFSHYRVDRMSKVTVQEERCDKFDRYRFNLATYTKRMFGMFNGDPIRTTLRFDKRLVNPVLDKFGMKTKLYPVEGGFEVNVEVSNSPVFLSWMFGFGDLAEIVSPQSLRDDMRALLQKVNERYE